ncbi:hypothetical protein ANCCAN_11556 [Ancylostoma caninum]|uniref:Uncharacterized protein n=1 Tax=Ancylostoma caninum TaxID=29170 RepID=A0A368GHF0_ANCCA|nr:hypothetical protein ANCCAN_11556 [Ancylostoma caninum]
MDASDIDGNTNILLKLLKEKNPSEDFIERDLQVVLEAIHKQKDIATTLKVQWDHLKNDKAFLLSDVSEKLLLVHRTLRTASITKERILRLTTRYVMMDRLYEARVEPGYLSKFRREDWLYYDKPYAVQPEIVLALVDVCLKILDSTITELEKRLGEMEQNFYTRQAAGPTMQVYTHDEVPALPQVRALQNQVLQQAEELKSLKRTISKMQETRTETAGNKSDEDEPDQLEDQTYFQRMVEEVTQPQLPRLVTDSDDGGLSLTGERSSSRSSSRSRSPQPPQPTPHQEAQQVHRVWEPMDEIIYLQDQVTQWQQVLRTFPYRNLGETSAGVDPAVTCVFCDAEARHFSDSCPEVQRGDDRFAIISIKGLCKWCLDRQHRGRCKYRKKECWYCDKLRGTIAEVLIPDEDGHHRAVCNIPDSRHLVYERLDQLRDEIQDLQDRRQQHVAGGNVDNVDLIS